MREVYLSFLSFSAYLLFILSSHMPADPDTTPVAESQACVCSCGAQPRNTKNTTWAWLSLFLRRNTLALSHRHPKLPETSGWSHSAVPVPDGLGRWVGLTWGSPHQRWSGHKRHEQLGTRTQTVACSEPHRAVGEGSQLSVSPVMLGCLQCQPALPQNHSDSPCFRVRETEAWRLNKKQEGGRSKLNLTLNSRRCLSEMT